MHGIVTCPQPDAAESAAETLRRGGNAVDAVVTAALVQGVVDPLMCGLGGYGVMLVHDATNDDDHVVDFFSRAPGGIVEGSAGQLLREFEYDYGFVLDGDDNETGYGSIAVPGEVAGLSTALAQFGTWPWRDCLQPAITVAEEGVRVPPAMHQHMVAPAGPDKPSTMRRLCATDESRALLTKNGQPLEVGDHFDRRDYARSLRRLAEAGPRDFYEGELAGWMVADFATNGCLISADDLARYPVTVAPAARGSYGPAQLSVPRHPSGGPTLVESLNLLEMLVPESSDWGDADVITAMATALAIAIADKYAVLAGERQGAFDDGPLFDKEHAARSLATYRATRSLPEATDDEAADTTHVAVVDRWGNAAALTHTLASGAGVITPGLGYMYNNYMHGFDPRPGKWNSLRPHGVRPASMCPTFVHSDGLLRAVAGATGSTRIVTSLAQVLFHLLRRVLPPAAAVLEPRINSQRNGLIQLEACFPRSLVNDLQHRGWKVDRHLANLDSYFGRAYVLERRDGDDTAWIGAADPRGGGGTVLIA